MAIITRNRWHVLGPYLDRGLDLSPADRDAWFANLDLEDPTLATNCE